MLAGDALLERVDLLVSLGKISRSFIAIGLPTPPRPPAAIPAQFQRLKEVGGATPARSAYGRSHSTRHASHSPCSKTRAEPIRPAFPVARRAIIGWPQRVPAGRCG